jgi:hypothetical protein
MVPFKGAHAARRFLAFLRPNELWNEVPLEEGMLMMDGSSDCDDSRFFLTQEWAERWVMSDQTGYVADRMREGLTLADDEDIATLENVSPLLHASFDKNGPASTFLSQLNASSSSAVAPHQPLRGGPMVATDKGSKGGGGFGKKLVDTKR